MVPVVPADEQFAGRRCDRAGQAGVRKVVQVDCDSLIDFVAAGTLRQSRLFLGAAWGGGGLSVTALRGGARQPPGRCPRIRTALCQGELLIHATMLMCCLRMRGRSRRLRAQTSARERESPAANQAAPWLNRRASSLRACSARRRRNPAASDAAGPLRPAR